MSSASINETLVIGAGIAGINAALKLAEAGTRVYLCDSKPYIGGTLYQLDKWFPDNHCGMCQTLETPGENTGFKYCLRAGLFNPHINVILNSEVTAVEGEKGNYIITMTRKSTGIRNDLCTGCGQCAKVCPVETTSMRFGTKHKAVFSGSPVSILNTYVIDKNICNKCGSCVTACPAHAIDLDTPDEQLRIEAGSIILSTGFEEYSPRAISAFGYGRFPNVVTNLELERMLSAGIISPGVLLRPSGDREPDTVAFLQCVGSRNRERDYCSAVCCMYALKEAIMLKQARPGIDVTVYFMDMRDYGKSYYRYYREAQTRYGIKFRRCRVPAVRQDFRNGDLLITSTNGDNKIVTDRFDMVVLSVGQDPSSKFRELCHNLGIDTNKFGFCVTGKFAPVETNRPGIYVCGTACGPKDITDTMIESTAAAGLAAGTGTPDNIVSVPPGEDNYDTALILCNCRGQLSRVIDTEGIAAWGKALPGIKQTMEVDALCEPEKLRQVQENLKANGISAAIIAGCSRLNTLELPVRLSELINIREQLAWVHAGESRAAGEKARAMIKMSLARINKSVVTARRAVPVTHRSVVIGGGLAGLTAALQIAGKGFGVELIEKSDRWGGNAGKIYYSPDGEDIQGYTERLINAAASDPAIHLRLQTEMVSIEGYAGSFKCTLRDGNGKVEEVAAGTVIVATGAGELRPTEYLYGKTENVITQRELEEKLHNKSLEPRNIKTVAMVQCVGSRDSQRPYCSRICCMQALKNALLLKQRNPDIEINIFYRDLMSYGLREEYYTRARENGIRFFQYELENKPTVSLKDETIAINAVDGSTGEIIQISPDILVLSPAIVPSHVNLAGILGVELTPDGFFKEAEAKFRPVDLPRDGIFVCGLAHSPRDISETIAQAQAAARQAISLLLKKEMAPGSVVSVVNERKCTGCEKCVKACPYNARIIDTEKGVVRVIGPLCRGCGTCVAECPNGAAVLAEYTPGQIFSMLDAAV